MNTAQQVEEERQAILEGLLAEQKFINPKYFYNHKGSKLFEQITQLDEYYPTRTERKILLSKADEIANYIKRSALIVEPGAGSCKKIEFLLDALHPEVYVPQDVSKDFLEQSSKRLSNDYPWLEVFPIASDFSQPINLPERYQHYKKYAFYPGSTIGNFEPDEAHIFLKQMRQLVGSEGGMILGVDLHKDNDILHAAYNDNKGVTAQFNLNTLSHINEVLNSDFDVKKFEHHALYNSTQQRIEMYLRSQEDQSYEVQGQKIVFEKGELVHTEHSYKYTLQGIASLAKESGFFLEESWLDNNELFSVNYLSAI
ncbi:L-histidine N(alpha)-methyltransferase [Kangiella sediminilitoris]|uniref:Methyltransferase n=1 Tax=Kangiella sediminilitoris TaxID=1144748 RepID=A0A1B3BB69_9GAMM|nr:L-histidine N(alpha)-methyltransferase [Kangiella sediminilitoris]AOE50041.1 Methyltransferase [Kangiella sediminilitoris]